MVKINDVCGRCCKDVKTDERAVGCEICGAWFHITCKGMPVEVYKFMVEDEAGEQLQWYCCSCKRGCTKLLQYVRRVEKMQMELEEKHNVIKEKVTVMKEAMIEEADLTKVVDRRLGDLEAKVDYLQEKVDANGIESVEGRLGVLEAKFVEMERRMVDWLVKLMIVLVVLITLMLLQSGRIKIC